MSVSPQTIDPSDKAEVMQGLNPFGSGAPLTENASAAAESQRTIAEIQAALIIAQNNPRNERAAMDRILNAFTRPELAEKATYTYARGGENISGPSIRAAEAIAQRWGNLWFGVRELDQRTTGVSSVEAYAWDLETNTRSNMTFQQPHVRYTKKNGRTILADPRDIYEIIANNGARRKRACILSVVPGDVTAAAVKQAELTLKSKVNLTPELLTSIVAKFDAISVSKEALEKFIQRRFDAITPALVVRLRGIYNSINDGMSSPGDWFELETTIDHDTGSTKAETVANKLKAKVAQIDQGAQTPAPQRPTAAAKAAPETLADGPDWKAMKAADIVNFLESTAQEIGLSSQALADIIRSFGAVNKTTAPGIYERLTQVANDQAASARGGDFEREDGSGELPLG